MKNKLVINKDKFAEIIDVLNLTEIVSFFSRDGKMGISFNNNKLIGIISDLGFVLCMSNSDFKKIKTKEGRLLGLLLNKIRSRDILSIKLSLVYIVSYIFVLECFYNFDSYDIEDDQVILRLDNEFKVIINSLDEIQLKMNENYSLSYYAYDKGDNIELELTEEFDLILNEIRNDNVF